ncbi:trace amine-associated receptor 13c-like [Hoplias malabaricus]|uniref:trace amine-associated receptor 13c-like n=1 Tax=Hoplias malabaricus TaxID=27720 RepID=UPI0034621C4B
MNFTGINQTDPCLLFHCPERSVSTAVYVLLYVSAAAVVLLTVCGNLLIIISVCHFKQLHTPTNMLILSLAVSDFLVGLLVIPIAIIWMIESCWIFNAVSCLCYIYISYFLTATSIFNVALIAVDRYVALSNPFLYTKSVSVNTMCLVVVSNWVLLLLYHIAMQYFNGYYTNLVLCPGNCFLVIDKVWYLFEVLLKFVVLFTVITVLYILVFVIARKHASAIRDLNIKTKTQTSRHTTDSMKSERKAARALGILVFVFLACMFPFSVYTALSSVIQFEMGTFQVFVMLVYLNSTINPVIYALFYPWFRRCVKLTLTLQIFSGSSSLIKVL